MSSSLPSPPSTPSKKPRTFSTVAPATRPPSSPSPLRSPAPPPSPSTASTPTPNTRIVSSPSTPRIPSGSSQTPRGARTVSNTVTPRSSPSHTPPPPSGAGAATERPLLKNTVSGGSSGTRARDLLRKHYGLGVSVPQPSGKPMDPMDLDSPAFDAKAYYDQLITTSSLPTLMKRENELLSEMRQLESERQSLVYNHHHELIAASDTIAAMKTRAESLDADLDLLKAAFSEISRLGAEVGFEVHHDEPGDRRRG
ncbi:hypothetical protein JAAARDRAFT_154693 [Jaapia argillacea MUCL 33604]|uniref:Vacuolar protein sorting-associated protein 51 homolog n=1 Tax=Jaapia argillacea MUCL 33604 TaxID=933084 RepID=A0A067Q761_9AGAM|nr:hypothetical protein JAAARDRAFT_154693 [Jaapia argillacea MUCL 33604]